MLEKNQAGSRPKVSARPQRRPRGLESATPGRDVSRYELHAFTADRGDPVHALAHPGGT